MVFNKKGFSLAGVLTAVVALGIIVLAAQSVILLANRFISESSDQLEATRSTQFLISYMCQRARQTPAFSIDRNRSYKYNSSNTKYEQSSTTAETRVASGGILILNRSDLQSVPDHSAVGSYLNSGHFTSSRNLVTPSGDASDSNKQIYKLYTDSHTLISYASVKLPKQLNSNIENRFKKYRLGYYGQESQLSVIAARCAKHDSTSGRGSFIDFEHGAIQDSADEIGKYNEHHTEKALYILEGLYRPFYFPGETNINKQIRCCDIHDGDIAPGTTDGDCESLKDQSPVIFEIHLSSEGLLDTDDYDDGEAHFNYIKEIRNHIIAPLKVKSIREFPLVKADIDHTFATGFIIDVSNSRENYFTLNFLEIQNTCKPATLCSDIRDRVNFTPEIMTHFKVKPYLCGVEDKNPDSMGSFLPLGADFE